MKQQSDNILEVRNLETHFFSGERVVRAVDKVSLTIKKGEVVGIVGETGSGKSVTALSVMRLIPWPPGKTVGGSVLFEGEELLDKSQEEMRRIRGRKMAMIFQEPRTAANPVFRIGEQMAEVIMLHKRLNRQQAVNYALEMLERVRISEPRRVLRCFPHELSGGMLQRVLMATALSCDPALLFADEPTTALDVTIQAQILTLLKELQSGSNMSIVFITHDLGVVAQICDRILVMYAGSIVESATVHELFHNPLHPYTKGLLGAVPRIDAAEQKLSVIPGSMPDLSETPKGCKFYPRCAKAGYGCHDVRATGLIEVQQEHFVSECILFSESGVLEQARRT